MKKILYLLMTILLVVGLTGCSLLNRDKKPTEPTATTQPETIAMTEADLKDLENLSKIAFVEEKESLTPADYTEEQKSEIARRLVSNYSETTGKEMEKNFQKYFGEGLTVEFQDIKCFMDHHNEEEQTLYYFDKEQDKYVYNDKHPGHGGGGVDFIGTEMVFDSIEIKGNNYIYNMKILFYGPGMCYDTGGCRYGSGYKSYSDSSNQTNALLDIDNSKYMVDFYGPPSLEKDKLMEDYKGQLDTYGFVFERVDGHFVFKEYKKA